VHLRLFLCGNVRATAFWQELWQEPLARTQKQNTQRAMQPQQQHTAALCGDVRVTAFWQGLWQDLSLCGDVRGTAFWQELRQEHVARSKAEHTASNAAATTAHEVKQRGQREPAALCGDVRIAAFFGRSLVRATAFLARTFDKNTKKRCCVVCSLCAMQ
jgi:hypothetical protein